MFTPPTHCLARQFVRRTNVRHRPSRRGPSASPTPLIFGEGPLTLTPPIRSSLPTSPPALSVGQRTPSCQSDSPLLPSHSLRLSCPVWKGGTLFSLSLAWSVPNPLVRLVYAQSSRSPGVYSVEAGVCPSEGGRACVPMWLKGLMRGWRTCPRCAAAPPSR